MSDATAGRSRSAIVVRIATARSGTAAFRNAGTYRRSHIIVKDRDNGRLVYSTDRGRVCPGCGWPIGDCMCSSGRADAPVPSRIVAKLRIEKKGRCGKNVTVVYDLPRNATFLKDLCQELKRACGTGGAVVDDTVEVQGDLRDRVRKILQRRGMVVKG
jgi:translation initiation factor 1